MNTLWGIDLGGTKIEGTVISVSDTKDVTVLARHRIETQADRGYGHIVTRIAEIVSTLESMTSLERPPRIGIGTPGAVQADGRMKNCNTTCLNGRELPQDLKAAVGAEIAVANDADCFALAEAKLGSGRGFPTVFGVIMGTGVGGGFVVDGRLLSGPNAIAGEWGHMTLDPGGRECYCGRKGCVETVLSGPSVEWFHRERTGKDSKLKAIVESVDSDAEAETTIRAFCDSFGRALAQVINVIDPWAIVLGGGAGQVPQLKTWGYEALKSNTFTPDLKTPLLSPTLGDSAGVFGAALLSL